MARSKSEVGGTMNRVAILTDMPGWNTKLSRIIIALESNKIESVTIYVEDTSMLDIVTDACITLPVSIKLLGEDTVVDNWQIGAGL